MTPVSLGLFISVTESQTLQLISGVVSGLTVHTGEEAFVQRAGQQAAGMGAAAGLALEGMAGAAAGAGLAASSAGDLVAFFTCKLGGQAVQGRFSKASFKDGDVLEMVIEPQQNDLPFVLAVRRECDKVLWMSPHCSRGGRGHKDFSFLLLGKLLFAFLFGGIAFVVLMLYLHEQPEIFDWFAIAIVGGIAAIAAPYYAFRFYRQWLPIAQQAEKIFATLGYPDPSHVDLPSDHKRYCKTHGIGWPYLVNGIEAGPWIYYYLDPPDSAANR